MTRIPQRSRITRATLLMVAALTMVAIAAVPAGAQGETIYETQFLDPAQAASEWGFPNGETSATEDGFTATITPGALTVAIDEAPNAWLSPDLGELPADVAVEGRIASSTGDESALFGVSCRAKLHSAGYVFLVGTDGYYTIGRFDGRGNAKAIVNAKGTKRTDAVDPLASNIVRGECVGKNRVTLTLLVNGEKITSTVDESPPKKLGRSAFVVTEVEPGKQTVSELTGFAVHAL